MKIEFSSLRREMLLFFITNMAVVTSRANQQFPVCTLLLIANENSIFYAETFQKESNVVTQQYKA